VLCDIFLCILKILSEGNFGGFEDQVFVVNPSEQGKPGHPFYEASQ
jgi:hypothetical protein